MSLSPRAARLRYLRRVAWNYRGAFFWLDQAGRAAWARNGLVLLAARLKGYVGALRDPAGPTDCPIVYETANHRACMARGQAAGALPGVMGRSVFFDRGLAWRLLGLDALITLIYPFAFVANWHRPRRLRILHEVLLYRSYRRITAPRIARLSRLSLGNDHVGNAFRLSVIAEEVATPVTYVQHGAVHDGFPPNAYDRILVWDEKSAAVYRRRSPARIEVLAALRGAQEGHVAQGGYVLVAVTIGYRMGDLVALVRALRRAGPWRIVLRFHPAERSRWIWARLLRHLWRDVTLDRPGNSFGVSARAAVAVLAMKSSVIEEALAIDPTRTIWLRWMGERGDVYGVAAAGGAIVDDPGAAVQALRAAIS